MILRPTHSRIDIYRLLKEIDWSSLGARSLVNLIKGWFYFGSNCINTIILRFYIFYAFITSGFTSQNGILSPIWKLRKALLFGGFPRLRWPLWGFWFGLSLSGLSLFSILLFMKFNRLLETITKRWSRLLFLRKNGFGTSLFYSF